MNLKMEVYSPALELLGVLEKFQSILWEDKAFSAGSFTVKGSLLSGILDRRILWGLYNLSVNQDTNEPVFYSTELDDVLSSEYSYNSQDYRNVALVAYDSAPHRPKSVLTARTAPERLTVC